jgi:hypothetical protein
MADDCTRKEDLDHQACRGQTRGEFKVGAPLWEFIETHVLEVITTENPAQSFVRMAYKAEMNGLAFERGTRDIECGYLHASHIEKVHRLSQR